jgi:cysteine desulfurase
LPHASWSVVSMAAYLDHAATTPVRPEVWEAMRPYLTEQFGNPSSVHSWGRNARAAIEQARERVADAIGARRDEIVLTAGGTEADNIAVLGRWRVMRPEGARAVCCTAIEHKAVIASAKHAAHEGAELILLAVDQDGSIDEGGLDEALAASPAIVSVMWVNNEVGTVQPMARIAERCRECGVTFHTDAVQAFGKLRVDVGDVACDLLSISAHKFGGPKGTGVLYVRDGVNLEPLEHGGGQERTIRPGTENVAGIVGLGVAAELAAREQESEAVRLETLRDELQTRLCATVRDVFVNGGNAPRAPHILNVSVPGAEQDALLISLDLEGIAVSSGSACQSGAVEPSHVLVAMGRSSPSEASVRFSLGRASTHADIMAASEVFPRVVERVRAFANL